MTATPRLWVLLALVLSGLAAPFNQARDHTLDEMQGSAELAELVGNYDSVPVN
jgi:hypothetical protein